MATLSKLTTGTATVVNGSTWAGLGNLTADDAVLTTFTSSVSGTTGQIDIASFDFSSIPAGSTINNVTVRVNTYCNNVTRCQASQYQVMDGATTIGAVATGVLLATPVTNVDSFSPSVLPTLAQLKSSTFKIRITARKAASSQSGIVNYDFVEVVVDYTAPAVAAGELAVRNFNGTSDYVRHSIGGLSAIQYGTAAAICKITGSSFRTLISPMNSSGASSSTLIQINDLNQLVWWTGQECILGTAPPMNTWLLIVARKPSGTTAARFSYYNFDTGVWTHGNGSPAVGVSGTPGASGFLNTSTNLTGGSEPFAGRAAVTAVWPNLVKWAADTTGDAQIEAAGLEDSLAAWVAAAPTGLWRWDGAVAAGVNDLIGSSNQAAISGTTQVIGDGPPGLVFDNPVVTLKASGSVDLVTTSAAASEVLGAITFAANSLVVVVLTATKSSAGQTHNILRASASGLTFTEETGAYQAVANTAAARVLSAPHSAGGSTVITIDSNGQAVFGLFYAIYEITGHDTSDPIGAVAQAAQQATLDGAYSLTLGSAPAATSKVIAAIYEDSDPGLSQVDPGSGWTEDIELDSGGSFYGVMEVQRRLNSTSTSVPWTDIKAGASVAIYSTAAVAIEIKKASGAAPPVEGTATGAFGFSAPAVGKAGVPEGITGLALWWRAEDLVGLADGAAVGVSGTSPWASRIGTSTALQATSGKRPLKQTVAGKTVVRFDGTDDILMLTGDILNVLRNLSGATVFVKAKLNTVPPSTWEFYFHISNGVAADATRFNSDVNPAGTLEQGGRLSDTGGHSEIANVAGQPGTSLVRVLTTVLDYANADLFSYMDGVLQGSNTAAWGGTGTLSANTASVAAAFGGEASDGNARYLAFDLYEVLIYQRVLNSTEQQAVEAYLAPPAGGLVTGTATGVFGFSAPAAGTKTITGTAIGSFGFTSTAAGSKIVQGTATGAFGFSSTATGQPVKLGTATGSFGFSSTGTGTKIVTGTATGAFVFSAPVAGEAFKIGIGTGLFGFSSTASGITVGAVSGTATGLFGFSSAASGEAVKLGTATGAFGFSAPATGQPARLGSATGVFGFTATAQGARVATGAASGSFGFSAPAIGQSWRLGTSIVFFGFSSTATGTQVPPVTGTATGAFGFSAPASGVPVKVGVATASFGFASSASGQAVKQGTATGVFGFSAPASGQVIRAGTASGLFGFSSQAAGQRVTPGTATGLFGFSSTAAGVIFQPGVGTGTGIFGFSSTATGRVIRPGTASGVFGFTSTASGQPVKISTASGLFGFSSVAAGTKIPPVTGTGIGVFGFSSAAQGSSQRLGTATGIFGFSAPAVGTPVAGGVVTGSATGVFGFTASADGIVLGGTTVTGSATGQFGFTSAAVGTIVIAPLVTGEGSGLFGFSSLADGTIIIPSGTGTATGIFGFTSTAVGIREGFDMAVDLLGYLLHEFLACSFSSLSPKPGRAFVAPGQEVAWDDCCNGQLWVRTISVTPSGTSNRIVAAQPCGVILWNAVVGVGVVRCASSLDDFGNPPDTISLALEADQMGKDRANLEQSIMCCWRPMEPAKNVTFVRWVPVGPQGGCVGGEWHVSLTYGVCDCV